MGRDIFKIEHAFALLGAPHAQRQQPAEPAIGGAVARVGKQAWCVFEIETAAHDEFDAAQLARGEMSADDASKRVAVGDGDGRKAERPRRRHQLFRMRAAAQEGEIAGDV